MSDVFDLPHLLTDVVADVQATADDKGVHVIAHNLAAMPQWVEGDEPALRRMLLNTLDLVVGAATDGTVILRLEAHDPGRDRWICVIAWRSSAGNDEEHDASIHEVKSAFIVTLRATDSASNARPLRILVVDDSAQHRSMVAAYLTSTAHVVTEAESGEDAIRRVGAGTFDVILMDVQMPGMGGTEAIGVIRAFESTLQQPPAFIVALTAMGGSDDETEATLAGANDCLQKPLGRDDLFRMLAAVPAAGIPEPPDTLSEEPGVLSEQPDSEELYSADGLLPPQLLALARHQLGAILKSPPDTQLERLRMLGEHLTTTATDAGLGDIAHLAASLEAAAVTGSLTDAQTAARTLQAWVLRSST